MERLNSGDYLKDYLRHDFEHSQHWSDEMWKSRMAGAEKTRKDFKIVLIHQDKKLRALQGHSGRNLIDPSLQDNVLIQDNLFEYIYHIGRAVSLQSITNSG